MKIKMVCGIDYNIFHNPHNIVPKLLLTDHLCRQHPDFKNIKNKTFNLADLTTVKAKSNPKNHPPRLNFLLTVQTRDTTLVHKILTETETYLFYYDSTFNLQNPPSSTLSSEDVVSPLAVGSGWASGSPEPQAKVRVRHGIGRGVGTFTLAVPPAPSTEPPALTVLPRLCLFTHIF